MNSPVTLYSNHEIYSVVDLNIGAVMLIWIRIWNYLQDLDPELLIIDLDLTSSNFQWQK